MDKQKYIFIFIFTRKRKVYRKCALQRAINQRLLQTNHFKTCLGPTLLLNFSIVVNMLGIEIEMICSPVLE
jgi:hypothetical protein